MADQLATSVEVVASSGAIRLGEVALPGHVQSIEVGGEVLFDERRAAGRSGSLRQPKGFDDASVSFRVQLLDRDGESAEDQVKTIDGLFKAIDSAARPQLFRLVNVHTKARGVRDVQWKTFRSVRRQGGVGIEAELVFVEHRPPIVNKERAASWKADYASQAFSTALLGQIGQAAQATVLTDAADNPIYGLGLKPLTDRAEVEGRLQLRSRNQADRILKKVAGPQRVKGLTVESDEEYEARRSLAE